MRLVRLCDLQRALVGARPLPRVHLLFRGRYLEEGTAPPYGRIPTPESVHLPPDRSSLPDRKCVREKMAGLITCREGFYAIDSNKF
jgi:hypothetical protein